MVFTAIETTTISEMNLFCLYQVLHEASYLLPLREFYHHKRDNNIMLVLHNPYNQELRNHVDWHIELHSNMGFRYVIAISYVTHGLHFKHGTYDKLCPSDATFYV